MSSNISDPLQNKSDDPSITMRKTSGDLDETEKELVTTNNTFFKEGNTYMVTKLNAVKEAITPPISKKKIDTFNKTEKSQASNKTVDTSSNNKSDQGKSLDKSRSNQITDMENIANKVNKSSSILRSSLSNKSTKI